MTPTVFLVILCLGVASATTDPDASPDAELQEQKITYEEPDRQEEEGRKKAMWDEIVKTFKLHNSENDQETDGFHIEMSGFGELTDEEFMKMMNNDLRPMFGEEKKQTEPVDNVPELDYITEIADEIPIQEQPE